MIRTLLVATAVVAFSCVAASPAAAQFGQGNSPNNLFQQYSTGGAGLYPAPHYSPQLGGQAMYTYQPLMPHEMMYQHQRNYYNYYNTGGYMGGGCDSLNKTTVKWQSGTNHMGPFPFSTKIDSLNYRMNKKKYCLDGNCGGSGRGGRLRGHFHGASIQGGCASGNCGTEYSSDIYQGTTSGCSSCAAAQAGSVRR